MRLKRWASDPWSLFAVSFLFLIVLVAIAANWIMPFDPTSQSALDRFLPPSTQHPFGTDHFGRDVFSRVIAGARVSIGVGSASVFAGGVIGAAIGITTGYWAGTWFDSVLQRIVDTLMAPPSLVVAIVFVAITGRGLPQVIAAIALVMAPRIARVSRGIVISLREEPYVLASQLSGAKSLRVMTRHLLPGVIPTLTVLAAIGLGQAIMIEAFLSFLGYGVPPPAPSWGGMLSVESKPYFERAPWMAIAPGIALGLTVLSANLASDALRLDELGSKDFERLGGELA